MDHRYPYNRRLFKRAHLHKRVGAVAMLGVTLCTAAFALMWRPGQVAASLPGSSAGLLALALSPANADRPAPRRIYPYSVVPGGVSGQTELARAVRTDRVVAAHYATFDVARAHPVTVAKPRAVHVSYRKGDKVYWTAKKVMLAEGETLLTDGDHEMRARCANRISDVAQFPVEEQAPSAEVLDSVVEEENDSLAGSEALALVGDAGIGRHTGRAQAAMTYGLGGRTAGAGENAGEAAGSGRAGMGGMQGMTLAQTNSSRSYGAAPRSGSATPAGPGTPPTLDVSLDPQQEGGADDPVVPAVQDSGTGTPQTPGGAGTDTDTGAEGTPPSQSTPPVGSADPLTPATGGGATPSGGGTTGGGGTSKPPGVAVPGEPSPGTDPGPFIPEPGVAPPAPSTESGGDKPAPATVLEPGSLWLAATALAGLLVARRQGRAG